MRSRTPCRGNFLASCIPKGASDGKSAPSWQDIAAVYPKRAGIGKICAPCIRKALQTAFRECIARISCQGGALFAALTPRITHGARILPFLGVSFGCCGRGEGRGGARGEGGCRRSACGLCAAPLCAGQRGVFTGSPHAASSCPRPRARCSCCRACPRVRRARCPRVMVCSFCAARSASSHARGKRIRSASLNLPASPPTCSLFSPAAPSPRPHCARSSIALSEPPPS